MWTFVAYLALAWAGNQSNECENDVLLQVQHSEHMEMNASVVLYDDDCKNTGWFCQSGIDCIWRPNACRATCAEECQPCIDESYRCASWLCSINAASCRKTCAKHCQVNCDETPELGECQAKVVACELSKKLEVWESKNANITKVQKQLRDLCKTGSLQTAPMPPVGCPGAESDPNHSESSNSTLLEVAETCDKDTEQCATDVTEALKSKSFLIQQALKAPGWLAKSGVDTLKEVLKAGKTIALRGTIAFAFLSAGISAFFPKLGQDPQDPCHGIEGDNWAKCVWAQIFPLVEQFVDAKIDNLVEELWEAKLKGYNNNLWYIHTTVKENTGDKKEVPEKVVNKMVKDLENLHQTMIRDSSQFMLPFSKGKVAGLYFSQFASIHYSVITSILANNDFRTAGFRKTTQQILMCYANQIVHKTLEAREARLKALEVKGGCGSKLCCLDVPTVGCQFACYDICHDYKDTFQDCDWSPGKCKLKNSVKCEKGKILPWKCKYSEDTCPSSTEGKKWTCHENFVKEQMDEIWSTWLTAVPYYLQFIGQLDAMKVEDQRSQEVSNFYCPL